MIATPIFAANWKMNNGPTAARTFVEEFLRAYAPHPDRTVILFPAAVAIESVVWSLRDRSDIASGVQNIGTEAKGAFTGEISAPMARDAGATWALVGHSERRHVFGETNQQTAAKCVQAFDAGLVPMLCVGETLAQRENGTMEDVVVRQITDGLASVAPDRILAMAFAYEPVWAIGTGKTATGADAAAMHGVIRRQLVTLAGPKAESCPILYGGSVNATNAASLLAAPGVSGLLVGGASLDVATWARICQT